jgi:predicted nuclease of predicted toxin-antitoxin system
VSDRIRFHLDENVDSDVAKSLRRQGIDVTTTAEMSLTGQTDEAQLAFVCQSGRVLMTHDADFLRFASQSSDHCGIAFCRKDTRTLGEIIRSLMLIYEVFTAEEVHGHVEYL